MQCWGRFASRCFPAVFPKEAGQDGVVAADRRPRNARPPETLPAVPEKAGGPVAGVRSGAAPWGGQAVGANQTSGRTPPSMFSTEPCALPRRRTYCQPVLRTVRPSLRHRVWSRSTACGPWSPAHPSESEVCTRFVVHRPHRISRRSQADPRRGSTVRQCDGHPAFMRVTCADPANPQVENR